MTNMEPTDGFSVFVTPDCVGMRIEFIADRCLCPPEMWNVMPPIPKGQIAVIHEVKERLITVEILDPKQLDRPFLQPVFGRSIPGIGIEIFGIRKARDFSQLGRLGHHLVPAIATFDQHQI